MKKLGTLAVLLGLFSIVGCAPATDTGTDSGAPASHSAAPEGDLGPAADGAAPAEETTPAAGEES